MIPTRSSRDSHLDLSRAPYVVYGVHYIDLVSLAPLRPCALSRIPTRSSRDTHLDLRRAPYVLYGVYYIDLVSLTPFLGYQRAAVVTHTLA